VRYIYISTTTEPLWFLIRCLVQPLNYTYGRSKLGGAGMRLGGLTVIIAIACLMGCAAVNEQQFQYLEEVEGGEALDWVRAQNKATLSVFEGDKRFERFLSDADQILNAKDRIAYGQYRGGAVYNFWQDQTNVRGVLRRTSMESYTAQLPVGANRRTAIEWEMVLDVDALAKAENENWVYKGSVCLAPNYTRCLLRLSRGGSDAAVYREFDITTKTFVENGFVIPQAKTAVSWVDEDTLLVGTDWGPNSLTNSGYPRQTRLWKRGQLLENATLIFEGQAADVGVWPGSFDSQGIFGFAPSGSVHVLIRATTFYTNEIYWVNGDKAHKLALPDSIEPKDMYMGRLLLSLRKPWTIGKTTHPSGALVSVPFNELSQGKLDNVKLFWAPTERSSLEQVAVSANAVYLSVLEDVNTKIYKWVLQDVCDGHMIEDEDVNDKIYNRSLKDVCEGQGGWSTGEVPLPGTGTARIVSAYPSADTVFINFESFTTPDQLLVAADNDYANGDDGAQWRAPRKIDSLPARFNAADTQVQQLMATSKDGTEVPYFLVTPKGYSADGQTPTLLYGYGGFEISLAPSYRATYGKLWLERGGAYVIANIRGGGEFGPRWHQAALKENRQRAYDDFAAVAEDLIQRKVTSSDRLGIMGGSNGGLLVGVAFTQRPDLFKAVVCQVPLLDMLRYTKLLAGASWVGEYGDPEDPKMRAVIKAYSPFHNLSKDKHYPRPFFVTSTKDDRVHPGHARKMGARMLALGHPIYYFENIEGGHGASANLKQAARRTALEFIYLSRELGLE
jgi:prolyl oligopeptidase